MSVSQTEAKFPQMDHPEASGLTCPICLELFSEPVSPPCGHVYCFACLQTMGEGLDQHSCPECQAEYQGTKALVRSLNTCSLIEAYRAAAGKADSSDAECATMKGDGSFVKEELNPKQQEDMAPAAETSGCAGKDRSGSTEQSSPVDPERGSGKGERLDGPKFKMASQITELSLKLEMAEDVLREEKQREAEGRLREEALRLLGQITDLSRSYGAQVMQLIEEELGPGEADVGSRVSRASGLTKLLRGAMLRAESLLTEDDEAAFSEELQTLQPLIEDVMAESVGDEDDRVESKVDPARVIPKLEDMNAELRERVGEIQRSLRSTLNPSEVTFDPETAHPNLVLSEDLKTVTFSAAKQPYPSSPQRFTNLFQVLSTQSFSEGDHCWQVELDGSPWIVGVCYSGKLARSGLPSALESSRSSWCLMWFNNLLTACEQGHSVPLKKTSVSRRLEIKLSFKTHRLSFYNVSQFSGTTHVYTFKANLTEPVHLAYRMMSAHPKGRVTICS